MPTLMCTTCGEPAGFLFGEVDLHTMQITSMCGVGVLAPSCEGCGGDVHSDDEPTQSILVPIKTARVPEDIDPCWRYEE